MSTDAWNPAQYERFAAERRRPFDDLLALVRPRPGMHVVDLGCGTGELTRVLHDHLGARDTLGVDRSPAMLAKSAAFVVPALRFEHCDIADFGGARAWDLVFSNAALHWVPDHEQLVARLAATLADGGQLAVQVPANHDHASHRVAAEVAVEPPFRAALGDRGHPVNVLTPEAYAALLDRLGFAEQHVRLQIYGHRLAGPEEVVEWVRGTLLTDYERRLPANLFGRFVARYRERLLSELPGTRPYFFGFKRILFWAGR
jgi:trans-aconitate 2-methyltransferase